jgi:hypothetical protein
MVGALYYETMRMLPNMNFNVSLTILYSENYFAGDLTHRYLHKELGMQILMDSAEMKTLQIQVGQSSRF